LTHGGSKKTPRRQGLLNQLKQNGKSKEQGKNNPGSPTSNFAKKKSSSFSSSQFSIPRERGKRKNKSRSYSQNAPAASLRSCISTNPDSAQSPLRKEITPTIVETKEVQTDDRSTHNAPEIEETPEASPRAEETLSDTTGCSEDISVDVCSSVKHSSHALSGLLLFLCLIVAVLSYLLYVLFTQ